MSEDNKHLWDRFCRLGEMIGDGLHREPGGSWISRDYKQLSKILVPKTDFEKAMAKKRSDSIDVQMQELLAKKPCNCGGVIKQARKGSLVAYCQLCNQRYKAKTK